ncbi:cation/H(+) antiporter 15-like [Zingiber officinale]|uniref:cation/H(+) antiporter 15-like n=1 Tax=Zingiber officinale TaxID=94328 RepID=UPI001C4B1660|nr:cation/H(+) antiporter 15-like [Zingiber officinale]
MHQDICGLALEKGVPFIVVQFPSSRPLLCELFLYSVKVFFWGGNDGREALTYAVRMVRHPGVRMLVTRFLMHGEEVAERKDLSWDDVIFKEFVRETAGYERVTVEQVAAQDINDTVEVIKSIGSECDLVMVGRVQCAESMLEETLGKWVETLELGVVGDMLASSDFANFSFSVPVVHQHT